ncbi:hypothetical protein GWI72_10545 [Microvirga tunisiensis]|uniref:Uncharacterized protein n=1 Tax=Pannonibacter tanglangensis TaxID=2750084 RepID=A0A7X5J9V1_9HYPH|nr:hypothetical protein [Pannonibacter sp. XCT-53]NBN78705.1 hypothetical protein [Pannonibacter sp. XCT-53]
MTVIAADGNLRLVLEGVNVTGEQATARFRLESDGVCSELLVPFDARRMDDGDGVPWAYLHRLAAAIAAVTAELDDGRDG